MPRFSNGSEIRVGVERTVLRGCARVQTARHGCHLELSPKLSPITYLSPTSSRITGVDESLIGSDNKVLSGHFWWRHTCAS